MGYVYRARDTLIHRTVAMKVLPSWMAQDEEVAARFAAEARAIAQLVHQNIVVLYDYGHEQDHRYLVMQYVEGKSLSRLLADEGQLSYPRIIEISKCILRALRFAHDLQILHRDVKSSNILLDRQGHALLGDFGIAQMADTQRLTTTGMALGTPEYMSPEQCQGRALDQRTDLYSLGIVLYEAVTGNPPFLGDSPLAVAFKQVHDIPPLPSALRAGVPKRLDLIIAKALAKKPEDRYGSATEMLHDLDTVDLAEFAETRLTPPSGGAGAQDANRPASNRRITDRRRNDRRKTGAVQTIAEAAGAPQPYLRSPIFWLVLGIFLLALATFSIVIWAVFVRHAL